MFESLPFSVNNLAMSVGIIIVFLIAGKIFTVFAQKYLKRWADNSSNTLDDQIVSSVKAPFTYVIWFLGIKIAVAPLQFEFEILDRILDSLVLMIAIYAVVVFAGVMTKGVLGKVAAKTESSMDDALMPLITKAVTTIIVTVGIMWLLGIWGIDLAPLLASLGIAGLALGFAVKDSLANIFGGISLILDQTIKVGDKVKLESGEVGHIEDVGLRSTKLRTFSNELITVPNGQLANSRIQNYTQPSLLQRVEVSFGVGYDSDVDLVRKVVYDALITMEGIDTSERVPKVLFIAMEDFYLKFEAQLWIPNYSQEWDKQIEANNKIFAALKANNISIPFPTQEIIIKK